MKADVIKVNQLIEIEYDKGSGKEYLPSRIEEITAEYWHISMPMRKGVFVTLRMGQQIKIMLKYKNSMVGAVVTVAARRRGHIPVLIVDKPKELVTVNQKRTFVRLPVAVPVAFRLLLSDNKKGPIMEGVTGDISAGGMLLLTQVGLEQGQKIEMEIRLPEIEAVYCRAHIVRVLAKAKKEGDNYKFAVEYDGIKEGQRDKIFRFIFEKQRQWIKKGVSE